MEIEKIVKRIVEEILRKQSYKFNVLILINELSEDFEKVIEQLKEIISADHKITIMTTEKVESHLNIMYKDVIGTVEILSVSNASINHEFIKKFDIIVNPISSIGLISRISSVMPMGTFEEVLTMGILLNKKVYLSLENCIPSDSLEEMNKKLFKTIVNNLRKLTEFGCNIVLISRIAETMKELRKSEEEIKEIKEINNIGKKIILKQDLMSVDSKNNVFISYDGKLTQAAMDYAKREKLSIYRKLV